MNILFMILVFYISINTCIFAFMILPYITEYNLTEDKKVLVCVSILCVLFLPIFCVAAMFDKDIDDEE